MKLSDHVFEISRQNESRGSFLYVGTCAHCSLDDLRRLEHTQVKKVGEWVPDGDPISISGLRDGDWQPHARTFTLVHDGQVYTGVEYESWYGGWQSGDNYRDIVIT